MLEEVSRYSICNVSARSLWKLLRRGTNEKQWKLFLSLIMHSEINIPRADDHFSKYHFRYTNSEYRGDGVEIN